MEVWILLWLAIVLANLPFLVERILLVMPPKSGEKNLGWRLLELAILYFIVGGIGLMLENKGGEIHRQGWQFYAVTAALFLVFAFPGFVYRYLWRKRGA